MEQPSVNLVALNPQPLPPDATINLVALNPQPLPPEATINLIALNPQPLPSGVLIKLTTLLRSRIPWNHSSGWVRKRVTDNGQCRRSCGAPGTSRGLR